MVPELQQQLQQRRPLNLTIAIEFDKFLHQQAFFS